MKINFNFKALRQKTPRALFLTLGSLAYLCVVIGANNVLAAKRVNIVMIMADDLGFSDLGCYGGEIETPNLDRLAGEGMRFTQFYNCSVCAATRYSVLTGMYPPTENDHTRTKAPMLAQRLARAGYRTSLSGKWGLSSVPNDCGFQEFFGLLSGCCNHFDPSRRDPTFEGGGLRAFAHNRLRIKEFPADFYTTDALTDHAVKQIRQAVDEGKPFFVEVCYTAPHFPLQAKPSDIAKYRGRYDKGYIALRESRHQRQRAMGIVDPLWKLSDCDQKQSEWRYDWKIVSWEKVKNVDRERRRMEVYAAMVDSMDQGVGRIMRVLNETGVADNTVVMFFSDNGGCATDWTGKAPKHPHLQEMPGNVDTYSSCGPGWGWAQNTPFRRYKVWLHEGGIATPFIVRYPGVVPENSICREIGHVIDLLPTCLQLAGVKSVKDRRKEDRWENGIGLDYAFRGRQMDKQRTLFWSQQGNRAVRRGRWKLVWGRTSGRWELYDMLTDRTETEDLASRYQQSVEELSKAWTHWNKRS